MSKSKTDSETNKIFAVMQKIHRTMVVLTTAIVVSIIGIIVLTTVYLTRSCSTESPSMMIDNTSNATVEARNAEEATVPEEPKEITVRNIVYVQERKPEVPVKNSTEGIRPICLVGKDLQYCDISS